MAAGDQGLSARPHLIDVREELEYRADPTANFSDPGSEPPKSALMLHSERFNVWAVSYGCRHRAGETGGECFACGWCSESQALML